MFYPEEMDFCSTFKVTMFVYWYNSLLEELGILIYNSVVTV